MVVTFVLEVYKQRFRKYNKGKGEPLQLILVPVIIELHHCRCMYAN